MLEIRCTIRGTRPLLFNKQAVGEEDGVSMNTFTRLSPREQAEQMLHYASDIDKTVVIPTEMLMRCIVAAGRFRKLKGRWVSTSKQSTLSGLMRWEEDHFPIKFKTWEVHGCSVPINAMGQRRRKYRPMLPRGWEIEFSFFLNDAEFPSSLMMELVAIAGERIGLGSFRIINNGHYGGYVITRWEEIEQEKAEQEIEIVRRKATKKLKKAA